MRYALLIALREYVENAKTKGFWFGIFMLPLILAVGIAIAGFAARSEPSRHYVLVDQSGALAESIEASVERAYQRSVLQAVGRYIRQNLRWQQREAVDLSTVPADVGPPVGQAAIDAFVAAGGAEAMLARFRPMLVDDAPTFVTPTRPFTRVDLPDGIDAGATVAELVAALRPYLTGDRRISVDGREERLFAAVLIDPRALGELASGGGLAGPGEPAVQYWSTNLTADNLLGIVRNALSTDAKQRLYVARGVDAAAVRDIEATQVLVGSFDPAKAEGEETVSIADLIVRNAPLGFVFLLWVSIFSVMQMLLNNTIEEKSTRIVDVLLSSVTPGELMMGKLLGIAGVGFTIVAAWLGSAFVGLQFYQGAGAEVVGQALDAVAASGLVPIFLLCFLFGYLIYAGLFLSLGALCNELKEAQSLQGPLMLLMMVPLFTMVPINGNPHGVLATIMTWIPIYTPFTMMNRAAADPPVLELIGATAVMIVTAPLLLWAAGRIFKIGLLRTGNRPKFAEVVQWLRGRADA
jgi:ABC-2 type transport system permease protein